MNSKHAAAEVFAAAADRATDAAVLPDVLRRNAALIQRVRELEAEVARLRGQEPSR